MTNDKLKITIFVITLLTISGCGVTQPVRTLPEGSTETLVSFGGPIIPMDGFAIPAPYLNLGVVHGLTNDISFVGNVHLTAALFKDAGLDAGAAATLVQGEGIVPHVTAIGRVYFFWDVIRSNNARIFPMATIVGSYKTGETSLFYFGADNLYQVHRPEYFIAPLAGYQFPLSERTITQIEVKWLAANKDTRHGVFEGVTSVGGNGGAGIFFGVQYQWE